MNKLIKMSVIGIIIILLIITMLYIDRYIHPYSFVSPEQTTISLKSIICEMCVSNVEQALKNTEGVISAHVSLESKEAYVTFNDRFTDVGKIEKIITEAGYSANDKPANPDAFEKLSECCKNPENLENNHDPNCDGEHKNQKSCTRGCCNN